jgi:Fe2+ or Zn2+ uptake regulation protein
VTPQRRVVAEVLDGEHLHLSAETVHLRSQERLPEISLATVYNTLNELVAMGEVLELSTGTGAKRYDPNVHQLHHHLVCTSCGDVRDVHPAGADVLTLTDDDRAGFQLAGVDVVFRGLCSTCRHEGEEQ